MANIIKRAIVKTKNYDIPLGEPLTQEGYRVIKPTFVATYTKNLSIYLGKKDIKSDLEALLKNTKDPKEKASLEGEISKCDNWISENESVSDSLERLTNSFDEKSRERTYMEIVTSIIKDHAESRNRLYLEYAKEIGRWQQKRREYISGLSKFKRAVRSKLSNVIPLAIGTGAGSFAALLGYDLRTSTEAALLVGTVAYIGKEGIKNLLFKNKPGEKIEEKLLNYYDNKINLLKLEEKKMKQIIYNRAHDLAADAYRSYISGGPKLRKKRVLKIIHEERDEPHIYEIPGDYDQLLDVEKIALQYGQIQGVIDCEMQPSMAPDDIHARESEEIQRLMEKHAEEDKKFLGEDVGYFGMD